MSNSSKPVKFAHLQKLANQSMLNRTHVIEIAKACIVAFMKAKNYSVVRYREKRVNWKKTEDGENIFQVNLKANQSSQKTTKLLMHDLLSNGLHEKVVICYLKQIRCTVC